MIMIIKKGGTSVNGFVFTDDAGDPIDLTGATFQLLIKTSFEGEDIYRGLIADIPDPELGVVNVKIPYATTVTFKTGTYPSEIGLFNSDGEKFYSQVFQSMIEAIIDN